MTQERLAERMEVDARTVREWERGTCAPRTFERAIQLGEVLDVSLEELGLSSSAMTAGRRSHRMAEDAPSPMTTQLIDDLVWETRTVLTPKPPERLPPMLDGAALLESDDRDRCWVDGMLGVPEQVGPQMFDDLQALTRSHAELSHVMAPRRLLPAVRCHLAGLRKLLRDAQLAASERRLKSITGEAATLVGWLSYRLGNLDDAHLHYSLASRLARESGDGPLGAYVLVQKSYIYSSAERGGDGGSPATALALLDEAQAAAGSRAPLFLSTWISARQAEEHAAAGDARASHQDLSRAERTLGAARTPGGGAFSPWDEARLAGFRGSCALLLGWPRQAVIALEGALVGTSASLLSPRSAVLTDCAAAYARQQELEKACALLTESLTIAGQAGLRPYVQRILGVRHRLAFCAASPAMRQLDERLRVLL